VGTNGDFTKLIVCFDWKKHQSAGIDGIHKISKTIAGKQKQISQIELKPILPVILMADRLQTD
jgi:hypothetical protein